MINFTTMENTLYAWIAGVVSPVVAIWADQNAPRPARPYLTLEHSAFGRVGDDVAAAKASAAGVVNMTGNREFTFSIQAIGPGARSLLESVNTSIQKESAKAGLRTGGLVFVQSLSPIQNIPELLDSVDIEERASLDLLFRVAQTYTDTVGAIDNAEFEPTIKAKDGSTVYDEAFEVSQT